MTNDLISREALKEYIRKVEDWESAYTICGYIDNAPTVSPEKAKESELIKAYTKGFDTGVETVKNERPQGEWIEFKYGLYYCSRCFERVDKDIERIDALVSKGERSNYCPACGAKMGGIT